MFKFLFIVLVGVFLALPAYAGSSQKIGVAYQCSKSVLEKEGKAGCAADGASVTQMALPSEIDPCSAMVTGLAQMIWQAYVAQFGIHDPNYGWVLLCITPPMKDQDQQKSALVPRVSVPP